MDQPDDRGIQSTFGLVCEQRRVALSICTVHILSLLDIGQLQKTPGLPLREVEQYSAAEILLLTFYTAQCASYVNDNVNITLVQGLQAADIESSE